MHKFACIAKYIVSNYKIMFFLLNKIMHLSKLILVKQPVIYLEMNQKLYYKIFPFQVVWCVPVGREEETEVEHGAGSQKWRQIGRDYSAASRQCAFRNQKWRQIRRDRPFATRQRILCCACDSSGIRNEQGRQKWRKSTGKSSSNLEFTRGFLLSTVLRRLPFYRPPLYCN